jgi:hypothetical protein
MASLPTLSDDGIALTHFIVAADVERAARFYSDVLGGEIVLGGEPTIVALAIGPAALARAPIASSNRAAREAAEVAC